MVLPPRDYSPPDQEWSTSQATGHKKATNSHASRHVPRSGLGLRLDATRLGSRASPGCGSQRENRLKAPTPTALLLVPLLSNSAAK